MFNRTKYINVISLCLVTAVNFVYFLKYSVTYDVYPIITLPLYFIISTGLILYAGNRINFSVINLSKMKIASVLFSAAVLIYILVVPRMGEIGRLPAIEDWINRFLNDEFPYNSPHTPSSYPVIFLLAYPFYLIGNTGLLPFLGIILFFLILFMQKESAKGTAIKFLILITSIVVYFEIVTRSELFFNMMLIALVVYICEKFLEPGKMNINFILTAVLTGFILSTRSVAALLFLIYFIYRFRFHFGNLIRFGIISIAVFAVFLLPFYYWDEQSFSLNGPFAVQTYLSNLPLIFLIFLFIIAIYSGWVIADIREFFFTGGVILFFAAAFSFLLRISETGLYEALFYDGYDISYFIFCVPLLILAISDYQVDRYRGKVYSS